MRKIIIFLFGVLIGLHGLHALADSQRVAVIDTGLNVLDPRFKRLVCAYKDFTGEGIVDRVGHGTHVTGTIRRNAGPSDYCLIILKYTSNNTSNIQNTINMIAAMKEAVNQRADIVNISAGGPTFVMSEYNVIKDNPQILFIVAAGNHNKNIDLFQNYYFPASYHLQNILPVGALTSDGRKLPASNYGNSVKLWALGEDIVSDYPCPTNNCQAGMTGTSMSTAVATGYFIKTRDAAK